MIRLLFLTAISLGLVACSDDSNQATAPTEEDQVAEVSQPAEAVEDAMDTAPSAEELAAVYAAAQNAYLADYSMMDGTVATESGLLYTVVREGEGEHPGPTDVVEVHYEGSLIDGSVFDSSYERDQTLQFPLDRVIPGWTEGLQYMQPGAEHILVIPPEMAYRDRTDIPDIPPNSVLIFRVELFSVTPN